MRRIAVLMTCYNRVNVTLECLDMLYSQELPADVELDVWLVDDASTDGTGDAVRRKFPRVNVIMGGGLFWNRGMRLAWDSAVAKRQDYDFFLWLNDDVKLNPCAVSGVLSDYEKCKGVIVGTFSSTAEGRNVSYGCTRHVPDGMLHRGDCGMNGNLVLVPRAVFDRVGPICGIYHHQYGDYDYGWMIRRAGFDYYSSSTFCGVCPQQPSRYFHLADRTLVERIKLLFNPKGFDLHDAWFYSFRNRGFLRAVLTVGHVMVKVLLGKERAG